MNGRAKREFYRFATAIGAEVLDRLEDAWFEAPEVEEYQIQTEERFVGSHRVQDDECTSTCVCACCGVRGVRRIGGPSQPLPALEELDALTQSWIQEHAHSCRSEVTPGFPQAVAEAIAVELTALSAFFQKGVLVPPHYSIIYRESHKQVVLPPSVQYGALMSMSSECTVALQAVIREEVQRSSREVEAVLFVSDPASLDAGGCARDPFDVPPKELEVFVAAVDPQKGGFQFLPLTGGASPDRASNWEPMGFVHDLLDGIFVEEFTGGGS